MAAEYMRENNHNTILDFGCGSAYKLIKYLSSYKFIGIELPDTVEKLKLLYSEYDWRISDLEWKPKTIFDLVICADVIEHMLNPDLLMQYFKAINFKVLFLSTPYRYSVYRGPPKNPLHVREWATEEFSTYVSGFFNIIDHKITNEEHRTQLIICTHKEEIEN